jgi:hypothetical protein
MSKGLRSVPGHYVPQEDGSFSCPSSASKRANPSVDIGHFESVASAKPSYQKYHRSAPEDRSYNGAVYDSKLEMHFAMFLDEHQVRYTRQPEFILQDSFELDGKTYQPIIYKSDFNIHGSKSELIVDAKGVETPDFKLKKKMFLFKFRRPLYCLKSVAQLQTLLCEHGVV